MECCCFLRNVQDLLADGKTPGENHSKVRYFLAMVEYFPNSARDLSRHHQFGKKVLPGVFLGYALIAGRLGKGDILVADIEELEKMDESEIYPRRINAKEALTPHKGEQFIFSIPDGTAKLLGRDIKSENSL